MIKLILIFAFLPMVLYGQDSIFFPSFTESLIFGDSIDYSNGYPRQDALIFQRENYDTLKSKYYHEINKVSEKGLVQSDSLWFPMMKATIGDTLWYSDLRYEVLQSHYTQSDWTPPNVPALFVLRPIGDCPDWVQPTGGHDAYNIDDCVTFEGNEYISLIDANVWSPTVYPAGWELQ